MLGTRAVRWVPFLNRYAEMAPACCNACRTCTTTNVLNFAALIGGAAAAPVVRTFRLVRRRFVSRSGFRDSPPDQMRFEPAKRGRVRGTVPTSVRPYLRP